MKDKMMTLPTWLMELVNKDDGIYIVESVTQWMEITE